MSKLKRCPCCGGEMKVDYKFHPLRHAIVHVSNFNFSDRCYGGTDYIYKSEQEAVDAWNEEKHK